MLILTLRTDKPEAEVGLYENTRHIAYEKWEAHRQLSETIHLKIEELLKSRDKKWNDITGIVIFKGPGSFTGLRIGMSVANALAYANSCPIVSVMGDDWIKDGIERVEKGENEKSSMPEYGAEPHITIQKK